jgi:hypothetical protein
MLRYVSAEHLLALTLVDRAEKVSPLASPYAAGSAVVLVLLLCLDGYLSSVERVTVAQIISEPWVTVSMADLRDVGAGQPAGRQPFTFFSM